MIEELSEEYLPEDVLHRENQIAQIEEVFDNFLNSPAQIGTNCLIFGVTGSGKTTIIKKVMQEKNHSVYVSCDQTQTAYQTLKAFFNTKHKTVEKLLGALIEKLKKDPKILIIDEVDKVKDFKILIRLLNTIYRKTQVPIILVTLRRNIIDLMPSDARKTLFFEPISLPAYNALELKDILRSRIKSIKKKIKLPKIEEGVISYISAIAARNGSARVLINMTLRCLQKNDFSHDYIEDTYKALMKNNWLDFVNDLSENEKEFLTCLLEECDYEKEVPAQTLAKKMELSDARISQYINAFEKYGAIKSKHENLGRAGGRRRFVKFVSKEIYEDLSKFMGMEFAEIK